MVITSPSAVIAFGDQVAKEVKESYSHKKLYGDSWIVYDILKQELEQFDNIQDKLTYLIRYECFGIKNYIKDKQSFDNAVKCLKEELKYKLEKEYWVNKYNNKLEFFR